MNMCSELNPRSDRKTAARRQQLFEVYLLLEVPNFVDEVATDDITLRMVTISGVRAYKSLPATMTHRHRVFTMIGLQMKCTTYLVWQEWGRHALRRESLRCSPKTRWRFHQRDGIRSAKSPSAASNRKSSHLCFESAHAS